MLETTLRVRVDALWDKLWAGGLANPLMAIDQINLLIFLRRLEEMDNLATRRSQVSGQVTESLFSSSTDALRWSVWCHYRSDAMFTHVQEVVIPWMRDQAGASPAMYFMRDAAFLIPRASLLAEAVATIDGLAITDQNIDTQGDIYEYMLSHLGVAGQIGQFRTPRHIVRMMVELSAPVVGETVIDPACGTGGFLIAAQQHMIAQKTSAEYLHEQADGTPAGLVGDKMSDAEWDWLRAGGVIGFDVDASMVRIASMNLILHGIPNPTVHYADALGNEFDQSPRAKVVLANPPFSGLLDVAEVSNRFKTGTRKTELLFLQLFHSILRSGGRAAVIVPDGVLFGTSAAHREIRQRLIEENDVQAVISLPPGSFRPYTGSSTAILVFQKEGVTDKVWMFDVQADGYSLDDRRLPTGISDLPAVENAWPERAESEQAFSVDVDKIRMNDFDLSLGRYRTPKPIAFRAEDPRESLARMQDTVNDISKTLQLLNDQL